MDLFGLIVELFTNADHFLVSIATDYGTLIYIAMFVIFFLETGIVVMSFLPGDSLLFVAGTVAAAGTASPWLIMLAVILGAIFGNSLGYATGKWLGNRIYDGSIHWIDGLRFELFSGFGAILWAVSIVGAGYLFGNIPFIQQNLSKILILGVVAAAMGPILVGYVWKTYQKMHEKREHKF